MTGKSLFWVAKSSYALLYLKVIPQYTVYKFILITLLLMDCKRVTGVELFCVAWVKVYYAILYLKVLPQYI